MRFACWLVILTATPAAADTIDRPSPQRARLRGSAHAAGAITLEAGFPTHTYTATRDGFVRVSLTIANAHPDDNHGRAWRPYLRVFGVSSDTRRGDGWSTNGSIGTATSSRASLVIRVAAGDELEIVATVAENVQKGRPAAEAIYQLDTAELRVIRAACVLLVVATPALAQPHDDYDAPTDTHVELVEGLWHDDVLAPGAGWHRYQFTATATGHVAVQMRAPRGHATVWSYLRIVDGDHGWAGVGNRKTNLCEVIIPVERGKRYAVIATSQQNANLARGRRQISDGPYTIAVLPVAVP